MRQNVAEVYDWIVDDVVDEMKDVFAQEGIDASVLLELRESWSRKLKESGAMGSNSHTDEHEWTLSGKSERAIADVKPPKPSTPAYHSIVYQSTADATTPRSALAIGVPHLPKRIESCSAPVYASPDVSLWYQSPHSHYYHPPGRSSALARLARQQQTRVISSSPAARPTKASTSVMDPQLLLGSLCSGATTGHSNPIHVVSNDSAFHLHPHPPLTTSLSPQVRLSGKRKEMDDSTSLLSQSASTKAVRRSSDGKATRVIPQRDGTDENPLSTPTPTQPEHQQEEADLSDDLSLSDPDDDEEPIKSSNCLTAQYDKVSRIKNRWRCQLKHGIFHVNGRDYLFKSANGEFTF